MAEYDLDLLPHRPPMRLVEEITDVVPGKSARGRRVAHPDDWYFQGRRVAHPDDWYFQGHFPGGPVVPAIVLVELLAQTGGFAAATAIGDHGRAQQLRVAAFGPFKFPGGAGPRATLEALARVVGRMGGLIKIEGEVTADGVVVATGSVTLAET